MLIGTVHLYDFTETQDIIVSLKIIMKLIGNYLKNNIGLYLSICPHYWDSFNKIIYFPKLESTIYLN
jgi:hypothetical protein